MPDSPHLHRRALLLSGAAATVTLAGGVTSTAWAGGQRVRRTVFKGRFTDPNGPDWVYLPFRVPRGTRRIHVSYTYEPSTGIPGLTTNVVDIGMFDNDGRGLGDADGFRGWSGGARREFSIGCHHATPGYLAGPMTPGTWRVALGPYLINGQGTPYTVVVDCHLGPQQPAFEPDPAPQEVPGTGPGWYRGDLHTHTVHSDGTWTRDELAAVAQAAGLDFIGSSEHNTSSATRSWGSHVPEGFLVVDGEEVTTRSGHWVAMGLPPGTWIDWRYRAADDKLQQFTDQVRELGGVSIAAHPFVPVPSIRWDYGDDYSQVDAHEVWNGPWGGEDETAVENWDRLLRRGTFVPAVGSSDSHHSGQTVGLPQSVMRLATLSAAEVVAAVKGGHLWIAESSAVDLTFTATTGEQVAECGDHLTAAPSDVVSVALHVAGAPGCVAQLLGPTGVLAGALAGGDGTIDLAADLPAGSIPYVRAEVRRPDGTVQSPLDGMSGERMVALTNPVFTGPSA